MYWMLKNAVFSPIDAWMYKRHCMSNKSQTGLIAFLPHPPRLVSFLVSSDISVRPPYPITTCALSVLPLCSVSGSLSSLYSLLLPLLWILKRISLPWTLKIVSWYFSFGPISSNAFSILQPILFSKILIILIDYISSFIETLHQCSIARRIIEKT